MRNGTKVKKSCPGLDKDKSTPVSSVHVSTQKASTTAQTFNLKPCPYLPKQRADLGMYNILAWKLAKIRFLVIDENMRLCLYMPSHLPGTKRYFWAPNCRIGIKTDFKPWGWFIKEISYILVFNVSLHHVCHLMPF